MADSKLTGSSVPTAGPLNGTELLYIVQSGASKKIAPPALALAGPSGPPGAAEPSIFSVPGNGRKWSAALAARSPTNPARLVVFGDSIIEGLYGEPVRKLLARVARYNGGRVDPGWVHASPSVAPGISKYRFGLTAGTANTPAGQNVELPRGLSTSSWYLGSTSTVNSTLTLQDQAGVNTSVVFDRAEFHYAVFGTAGVVGAISIRIDGALVALIDTTDTSIGAGNSEVRTYTWSGPRGPHTVTVTGGGSLPTNFGGVYLADGSSVWVYGAGDSGDNFASFNTSHVNLATPLNAAKAIGADCILWAFGINDYNAGDAAAASASATQLDLALIRSKTALPDVSLGVLIPHATSTRANWPLFVTAYKDTAETNNVSVLDLSLMLKDAAGVAGADPMDLVVDVDAAGNHTHLTQAGGEYWGDAIDRFMGGSGTDWAATVESLAARLLFGDRSAAFTYGGSFAPALILRGANGTNWGIQFQQSRGTTAAPTATQSGDSLGRITAVGYGATGFVGGFVSNKTGYHGFRARENFTDAAAGTDWVVATTPTGSSTAALAVEVLGGGGLKLQGAATVYSGSGAPAGTLGAIGDVYFRTDTPTVANQRQYVKTGASAWTGVI